MKISTARKHKPKRDNLLHVDFRKRKRKSMSPYQLIGVTHNSRGQVLTRTDETGIVDKFDYSGTNETLTTATRDFGALRLNLVTGFGYTAWGDVSSITDPRNNTTTFLTDKERRLTKRTECAPFNFETIWEWDDNGNQKTVKRQTGDVTHPFQTWSFLYSVHNDLLRVTDPSNNPLNFGYNTNRWLISRTDAEGRQWQFQYDELGRIKIVVDPLGNYSETRTYTDNGMLATIKDARNNTTNMQFDGFDRLFKRIYPNSTFEQFGYNKNNQVLTLVTRSGDTITNTYDVLTRLATRDPGPLPLQTMGYDLAGRLTSVSTPVVAGDPGSGNFGFGYDTAGRLTSQTMPDSKVVGYQLDANGNRTRLTWPDGYLADYVFDQLNRLTDIKLNLNPLSALVIGYDQLSRRTQLTYINGCSASYAYEWNNDLASLIHNFVGSAANFTMVYNKVHQLKTLLVDDAALLWTPTAAKTTPYAAASNLNQYPSVDGTALSYDNNGNLTASGFMNSAAYDALNRLTQVVTASTTNNYWLDPLNRQAQKEVNGTKTRYLYDIVQLIGEYDVTTGNIVKRYIFGVGLDEVLIQNAVTVVPPLPPVDVSSFLHKDRLASVIALTDAAGQVQQKYAYSPFGETPSLTGTVFGFNAQRYDAEIGLYNYKARYYSPSIGRFLQTDLLGYFTGEMNLYAYVGNDPVNAVDPLGLSEVDVSTIMNVWQSTMQSMNQSGQRFNGPLSNALMWGIDKLAGGNKVMGCVEQADTMTAALQFAQEQGAFQNTWNFKSYEFPGGVHTLSIAASSNPLDPVIFLDPSSGLLYVVPPEGPLPNDPTSLGGGDPFDVCDCK